MSDVFETEVGYFIVRLYEKAAADRKQALARQRGKIERKLQQTKQKGAYEKE